MVTISSHDEYQMTSFTSVWPAIGFEPCNTKLHIHPVYTEPTQKRIHRSVCKIQAVSKIFTCKFAVKFAEEAVTEIRNSAFENILKPKNQVLNHASGHAKLLGRDADFMN